MRGGRFRVVLPMLRAWRDKGGELRFAGVASSTRLDRQRERMTDAAIRKMGEYRGIPLVMGHLGWGLGGARRVGVVEECCAEGRLFRVGGKLDATSEEALRLFAEVDEGRRYGLSVGGRVKKARRVHEGGQTVRIIEDVVLDHIAVCQPDMAVNPDTYLAVLAGAPSGGGGMLGGVWQRLFASMKESLGGGIGGRDARLTRQMTGRMPIPRGDAERDGDRGATGDCGVTRGTSQSIPGQEAGVVCGDLWRGIL